MAFDLSPALWLLPLGAVAWAVYMLFTDELWDVRAARRLPASSLRSPGEGLVKLVGTVQGSVVQAPLDGQRCVGFELMVEGMYPLGRVWNDVGLVRQVGDFMLRGHDGAVMVRGEGVRLKVLKPFVRTASAEELAKFFPELDLHRWSTLRAYQWAIGAGARVAVVGVVRREPDPDPGAATSYRESGTRLVVESPEGGRAYLVDDPRALT